MNLDEAIKEVNAQFERQEMAEKLRVEAIEHIQRPVNLGEVLGEVWEWIGLAVYPGLIIWAWMRRW
jgi:hypothetical protein